MSREIVRAVFESQFYTLTRALWWTADLVRWSVGYAEEGCGSLGREDLVRVLREVVSLVPDATPADADYLELMLDTQAADTAAAAAAAATGGEKAAAAAAAAPAAAPAAVREMSWAEFSSFLEGAAEKAARAAKCGDGEKGIDPVRHPPPPVRDSLLLALPRANTASTDG